MLLRPKALPVELVLSHSSDFLQPGRQIHWLNGDVELLLPPQHGQREILVENETGWCEFQCYF